MEFTAIIWEYRYSMFTQLCIYAIKHSDDLRNCSLRGGTGTFEEQRPWVQGKELLDQAKRDAEVLPIVFAPAEKTEFLFAWALLDEIIVSKESTKYKFSNLRLFRKRPRKTELKKASNNKALARGFIRSYAVCHTPSFVKQSSPSQAKK